MKLSNIFNLIKEEEEEDGMSNPYIEYDPALKPVPPSTIQDIVNALTDINNYDRTLKTKFSLRDKGGKGKEALPKIFNLNQLLSQAKKEWDKFSEDEKLRKIKNIKNRVFTQTVNQEHVPFYAGKEAWEESIVNNENVQDDYNDWKNAGNEGSIENYLASLTIEDLKNTGLLGSKAVNYWPQKAYTKDQEIALNQATMREEENFIVTDDRVIFPLEKNKPFLGTQGEQGLKNIVNSILKTAKIETTPADVIRGTTASPTSQNQPERPKKDVVPPLSYTADTKDKVEKARGIFQKEIGEVPTAKYEIEAVETPEGRKYKLVVTGISADQRAKLFNRKTTLNESFDFERYQMLRRAGIIK